MFVGALENRINANLRNKHERDVICSCNKIKAEAEVWRLLYLYIKNHIYIYIYRYMPYAYVSCTERMTFRMSPFKQYYVSTPRVYCKVLPGLLEWDRRLSWGLQPHHAGEVSPSCRLLLTKGLTHESNPFSSNPFSSDDYWPLKWVTSSAKRFDSWKGPAKKGWASCCKSGVCLLPSGWFRIKYGWLVSSWIADEGFFKWLVCYYKWWKYKEWFGFFPYFEKPPDDYRNFLGAAEVWFLRRFVDGKQ